MWTEMKKQDIFGLSAALITPLRPDGKSIWLVCFVTGHMCSTKVVIA